MAPPKGNKYALGHHFGRPRKYDLKEEAKLLYEWANQDDTLILREWETLRDYVTGKIYEYAEMEEDFRHSLDYARKKIGQRREYLAMKNKINATVYHRYASVYDKELRKHDLETKAALSAETKPDVNINVVNYGDTNA